jgi:AraC-like DNA-binding protein
MILPDAAPEFIVHLGTPPEIMTGSSNWQKQPQAYLYSAAQQCLQLRVSESMDLFAIRFRPWGVSRFSHRPMSELLDHCVSPAKSFGKLGELLVKSVTESTGEQQRIEALNTTLLAALDSQDRHHDVIDALIKTVGDASQSTHNLSKALSRSSRTVNRIWQKLVGVSPRSYAKLMRFHSSLELINAGRPLAWVANECGFADQSHMARQIKDIAGLSPSHLRGWLGDHVYQEIYLHRPSAPWVEYPGDK